ncbi:hypothetical protein ACHQM5_004123 [Ranunculus cassubicifolius]
MATSPTENVIEQCKISPPAGSVPPSFHPLTILDILWLTLPIVERLLFYEFHHSKAYFLETILPKLKHSLSVTLQHFFPLAGNLAWPQDSSIPGIQYVDGDFVLLTVAESDYVDFTSLVGNHAKAVSSLYPLAPKLLDRSTDKLCSLMALQVTLFPKQGICIGITFSHVVSDGRAINHFIKSWASICKQHGMDAGQSLLPTHDRSMLSKESIDSVSVNFLKKHNITRDTFYLPKNKSDLDLVVLPTDEKVLATFVMRPSAINRLRQWVLSRAENKKLHLSTFVLTCAYAWVCLMKAQCGEEAAEEDTKEEFDYLIIPVDSRSRLDPPLPSAFFGNCITEIILKTKASDLTGNDGILIAAELIGNAIQKMEKGDALLRDVERLRSSDIDFSSNRILSVAGSPKFGIYETDFGWGNPKKSEVISIAGTGAIYLTESPTEVGGVEVGLARKVSEIYAITSLFAKTIEDIPC